MGRRKKMSLASRSLRNTFTKRQSPKHKPVVVAAKPEPEKPSSAAAAEGENDLRQLVNNFKRSCERRNFRKDKAEYSLAIRHLTAAKKFSMIEEVLEHQKSFDDIRSEGFAARIILLYGQAGMFDHARKVFDELPQLKCPRGIMSFNALLQAGIVSKNFDAVVSALESLPREVSIEPDLASYNAVVHALCKNGDLDRALSMLSEFEPDLSTFNTLLDALYGEGRFSEGERVFSLMEGKNVFPNVVSYNAKLRGIFCEDAELRADEVVSEMESRGIKPNLFTYNSLIKGYCDRGDLKEAMKWYNEQVRLKRRCAPNMPTYTALIPACCKVGDHGTAFEICVQAIKRRLFLKAGLFRQVIDGLVEEKKTEEASKLVRLINSAEHLDYKLQLPVIG